KYHTDFSSQIDDVGTGFINIATVHQHFALDSRRRNNSVHAIQGAQQSRLSTSGWANERHHDALWYLQRYIVQGLGFSVEEIQTVHRDLRRGTGSCRETTGGAFGDCDSGC